MSVEEAKEHLKIHSFQLVGSDLEKFNATYSPSTKEAVAFGLRDDINVTKGF